MPPKFPAYELYSEHIPDPFKTKEEQNIAKALREAEEAEKERRRRGETEHPELQEARELLGADFLGPEEVKKAFGLEIEETDLPELPYTSEDLEKAKERGEMLVLRVNFDHEGNPLTMERMQTLLQPSFTKEGKGQVLLNTDWYKNEPFFTQDTPKLEWKLISKDVLPTSTSKNYIDQTKVLRDALKKDNLLTPEELDECTDQRLEELRTLMATDWPEAAKQLSQLKINQKHRRTPVEVLYDTLLVFGSKNTRLLPNRYDWTQARSSGGGLVRVGSFGAGGVKVSGWVPEYVGERLGVVSSR